MNNLTTQTKEEQSATLTGEQTVQPLIRRATREMSFTQSLAVEAGLIARQRSEAHTVKFKRSEKRRKLFVDAFIGDGGPNQELADLFRDIALLMEAGRSIDQALSVVTTKMRPELKRVFNDAISEMRLGSAFSSALKLNSRHLPDILIPIVEANERTGTLQAAMRQIATAYQKLADIDRKFEYSPRNPGFILPIGIMLMLLPMAGFIKDPVQFTLYLLGSMAISFLVWTQRHKIMARQAFGVNAGRRELRKSRAGLMEQKLASARWSRKFVILWQCGVPIADALDAASQSAQNPYYQDVLRKASRQMYEGVPLSESLSKIRRIPSHLIDMIKTSEMTGDFEEVIDSFADLSEHEGRDFAWQGFVWKLIVALFIVAGIGIMALNEKVGWAFIGAGGLIGAILMKLSASEERKELSEREIRVKKSQIPVARMSIEKERK